MNIYKPIPLFLTNFANKLLNHFLGILLVGFTLNIGIAMSVQADHADNPAEASENYSSKLHLHNRN